MILIEIYISIFFGSIFHPYWKVWAVERCKCPQLDSDLSCCGSRYALIPQPPRSLICLNKAAQMYFMQQMLTCKPQGPADKMLLPLAMQKVLFFSFFLCFSISLFLRWTLFGVLQYKSHCCLLHHTIIIVCTVSKQ